MTHALVATFLAITAMPQAAEVEHFTRIDEAVKAAKGRDIIVDFTGSDWCGWCIKLVKEVFDQEDWKKEAASKFVFVELDFPRSKTLSDAQKTYNESQKQLYDIQGYPSIYVLDSKGIPYAKTGYQKGGPSGYLEHLAGFAPRKAEIADLRAKAVKGEGSVEALVAILDKAEEWGVAPGYIDVKEQLVSADAKDSSGRRCKLLRELALHFGRTGQSEPQQKYQKLLEAADPALAKEVAASGKIDKSVMPAMQAQKWADALAALKPLMTEYPDGPAGQKVLYLAGVCEIRSNHREEGQKLLETAIGLAPDSELATKIKQMLAKSKKAG